LLLGGVLLVVVLALVVLQGSFAQSSQGVSDVELKKCRLSAQSASTCFDATASFNGSRTFDLLGYQANPLLCNCSDFDPDAFTVSVGTAGLNTLDFSSADYSPLYFEDAPAGSYAVSLPLPIGSYQFFVVMPDRSVVQTQPDAATPLSDGRVAYSWNSLPYGSRIKVKPISGVSDAQKSEAQAGKVQLPAAEELETQADESVEKSVDSESGLKLLKSKEGALRMIFSYVSTEDYDGPLSVALPVAAQSIARVLPLTSSIDADESGVAAVASWDQVRLRAGEPFRIIVELKATGDLQSLSDEVESKLPGVRSKALRNKGDSACIAKKKSCIPGGIGGSCCGSLSCDLDGLGFKCQAQPSASPTPGPSADASASASASPSPQIDVAACVKTGQGCALTSILPGSIDQKCCQGSTCQLDGFSTNCKKDPQATPTPLPSVEPSVEPTETPPIDLGNVQIEAVEPWEWNEVEELKAPTPTPEPKIANVAPEPACTSENREPRESACCSGLQALAEDPHLPNSRLLCQTPENAKVFQAPLSQLSFADPTPAPSSASKDGLESFDVQFSSLLAGKPGVGTAVPFKGFLRDHKGDLYLVVKKPLVQSIPASYRGNSLNQFQFYMETYVISSQDNGKTWKYLTSLKAPGKGTYSKNDVQRMTTPALEKATLYCAKTERVQKTRQVPLSPPERIFTSYNYYTGLSGTELNSCYRNLCPKNDVACQKNFDRCEPIFYSDYKEKSEFYKRSEGMVVCATGACRCNPPEEETGSTEDVCTDWQYMYEPNLVETCTKWSDYRYDYCTQTWNGNWYSNTCSKIYEDQYNTDNDCIKTKASCKGVKENCYYCEKRKQKTCVETDMLPPQPVSYSLLGHFDWEYPSNEFFGMAPAKDGGVHVYYRLFSRSYLFNLGVGETYQNASETHVMTINSDGQSTDSVLATEPGYQQGEELRFIGYSGEYQLFTQAQKLFISTDGGITRTQKGTPGYLMERSWREYRAGYCKEKAFVPTVDITHKYDVVNSVSGPFEFVAGGNVIAFSGNYPLLQQPDGKFISPGAIYYPENNPARMVALAAKYLEHPVFNRAFYDRVKRFSDDYSTQYRSTAVDAEGGLHVAISSRSTKLGDGIFYQYYPASVFDPALSRPPKRVVLLTAANCPACDQVRKWLDGAGVAYQTGGELPDAAKEGAKARLQAGDYPLAYVEYAQGSQMVFGNDSIRLSKALGVILDPVKFDTVTSSAIQLYLAPGGLPVIWSGNRQYTNTAGQFPFQTHEIKSDYYPKLGTYYASPVTTLKWYPGFESNWDNIMGYWIHKLADQDPTLQLQSPTWIFADSEMISNPNLSALLVYQDKTVAGDLWADSPYDNTLKSQGADLRYLVYSSSSEADVEEPEAGSVLNELVPLQKLRLPIPLSTASAPTLTFTSNQNDVVFAKVVPSEDAANAFDVEVTLDARKYLKGGKLDVPVDAVEGKFTAKAKDGKAELPFKVPIKHVAPENLAYVTPEVLPFYTFEGKGVSKPVFVTNNFNRPLTVSCGSLFSRVVAPGAVVQVDVKPPEKTEECAVALDAVATRQVFRAEVRSVEKGSPWYEEDGLSDALDLTEDAGFRDCADRYCNCQQARQAADDFAALVSSHVGRINGGGSRGSVNELYPNGYAASTVLRTGTFDDLDDPEGACAVKFNGYEIALEPGQVYKVGFKVPQAGGWLSWDAAVPIKPAELVKQWSYATENGLVADKDGFRGNVS